MVRVEKLNVVLDIEEESLKKYLSMGYNQIDPHSGKIIKKSIPQDVGTLRVAYVSHEKEIEELKAKIAKLEAKVNKPKKPAKKSESQTEETQPIE